MGNLEILMPSVRDLFMSMSPEEQKAMMSKPKPEIGIYPPQIGGPVLPPRMPMPGRGFNYGSDNLKPGYTFGVSPGTMDRIIRPDGTYGSSIPSYGYITDSMGKVVAKQGDANWNDFYNPVAQPNPIAQQIPPAAPVSPVGGGMTRPQPAAPRFGGIRKVLGRGR